MFDMGAKMYGDAVVVLHDGRSILIDGANPGDDRGGGAEPLQGQIAGVPGGATPIKIDLLVVTGRRERRLKVTSGPWLRSPQSFPGGDHPQPLSSTGFDDGRASSIRSRNS